jgi:hypothetical protein
MELVEMVLYGLEPAGNWLGWCSMVWDHQGAGWDGSLWFRTSRELVGMVLYEWFRTSRELVGMVLYGLDPPGSWLGWFSMV